MTESDDRSKDDEDGTATALLILLPVTDPAVTDAVDDADTADPVDAAHGRPRLLELLRDFGFSCGPVVGDVVAVTGPPDRITALQDHVAVMHHPEPIEGANEELLAMLRPWVQTLVFDDPVEPFSDEFTDSSADSTPSRSKGTNSHDDVQPPARGEPPLDEPPA